jgi:hypothetical protein
MMRCGVAIDEDLGGSQQPVKEKHPNLRLDPSNHGSEIALRDFSGDDRPDYEAASPHDGLRIAAAAGTARPG